MKASEEIHKGQDRPLLIAVTQLTSTTNEQMNNEQRIPGTIVESVSHFSKLAKDSGCDGVVSSSQEVQAIKLICGSRFLTVTPGIRPAGSDLQDQKRITTPIDALRLGTDYMVIGRPITQAQDPLLALKTILQGA
jgi:orotidine-5'-phosphate decarboxylase